MRKISDSVIKDLIVSSAVDVETPEFKKTIFMVERFDKYLEEENGLNYTHV
jgi:hypothetical protein